MREQGTGAGGHGRAIDGDLAKCLGRHPQHNAPHTRFTHQEWVIFTTAGQNLHNALKLMVAANQGVDFTLTCLLIEVGGVAGQRMSNAFSAPLFCVVTLLRGR